MKQKKKYLMALILSFLIIAILIILGIKGDKNRLISGTEYVEISIEDTEAQGLAYTEPVRIDDKKIIANLEQQVNNGTEYVPRSTAWPDISPLITFYLENGEQYSIFTATFESDGEEEAGNYITVFKLNSNGEEDVEYEKKTYKIEADLETYATQLYNQFK